MSRQRNVRMPDDLDDWFEERAKIRNPSRPNVAGEIIAVGYEAKAASETRKLGDKIKTGSLRKKK